jgi:hypothetical protein
MNPPRAHETGGHVRPASSALWSGRSPRIMRRSGSASDVQFHVRALGMPRTAQLTGIVVDVEMRWVRTRSALRVRLVRLLGQSVIVGHGGCVVAPFNTR